MRYFVNSHMGKKLLVTFHLSASGDKYTYLKSGRWKSTKITKKEEERTTKKRTAWNLTKIYTYKRALKNTDSEHIVFSKAVCSYLLWNCTDRFQNISNMFWLQELECEFILALQTYPILYSCGSRPFLWQAWDGTLDLQDVDKTWTSSHELFISQVLMNHV